MALRVTFDCEGEGEKKFKRMRLLGGEIVQGEPRSLGKSGEWLRVRPGPCTLPKPEDVAGNVRSVTSDLEFWPRESTGSVKTDSCANPSFP